MPVRAAGIKPSPTTRVAIATAPSVRRKLRALDTARQPDLLDTSYFHVVFTVPHELNGLALENPFRSAVPVESFTAGSWIVLQLSKGSGCPYAAALS